MQRLGLSTAQSKTSHKCEVWKGTGYHQESRERIHLTHHRTCHLKEKVKNLELSFKQHCHDNGDASYNVILDNVTAHMQNAAEAAFKRSKHSEINKLSSLQGNKHSENKKDGSEQS